MSGEIDAVLRSLWSVSEDMDGLVATLSAIECPSWQGPTADLARREFNAVVANAMWAQQVVGDATRNSVLMCPVGG